MGYTEHFRIRWSRNKDKTASATPDSYHQKDAKKPVIHICIQEDSDIDEIKKNPQHHRQNNK